MKGRALVFLVLGAVAVAAATGVVLVRGPGPEASQASSHREAPLISQDPVADNTDLYAFVSPDRPDAVTIIANYIPLEQAAGGPNFASFGDDVRYKINVDNTGDGEEDIVYQFRFRTKTRNANTFLYNTGTIDSLDDEDWNRPQVYSVARVKNGTATLLGSNIATPPANVGPRSTPSYAALAQSAVTDLPGGIKVFAGQRDDPFYVDLGSIFDLAGLRPFNNLHDIPLAPEDGVDGVAGFNTHAIAIQVPIAQLTGPRGQKTIGIYASAERRKVRVLEDGGVKGSGGWVQVSRLAEPLINEAVIPIGMKDLWNSAEPEDDAQFVDFYLNPEVTRLENALYDALDDANETNRQDLVSILLTGVPGLNFTGNKKADLLRLNMDIAPSAPVGQGDRLAVVNGDLAGFPNGRRLEDDVVDIELRAFAEGYGPILNSLLGLPNRSPNNLLADGVDGNELTFDIQFPYLATPHQGYEQVPPRREGAD
jgi:hypothetical protein